MRTHATWIVVYASKYGRGRFAVEYDDEDTAIEEARDPASLMPDRKPFRVDAPILDRAETQKV